MRIFTRSGGVWTRQGTKLVGTGYVGPTGPAQGTSVALSADGNTAIVGGPADYANAGRKLGLHAQRRSMDAAAIQARRPARRR